MPTDTPVVLSINTLFDLAPVDQLAYFAAPKETLVSAVAGGGLIIAANPLRAVLYIVSTSGNIGILPGNTAGTGIPMNNTAPFTRFTSTNDGPFCTAAWYNTQLNPANYAVFELFVNRWIDPSTINPLGDLLKPQPIPPANVIPTYPGVNGGKGILDYWHRLVAKFGGK